MGGWGLQVYPLELLLAAHRQSGSLRIREIYTILHHLASKRIDGLLRRPMD